MKRTTLLLAAALTGTPSLLAAQAAPVEAAATITPADFLHRVEVLAHDSMRGRDTPSPELDRAAAWIADEFRSFGLKPGGDDGTFMQDYAILRLGTDFDQSRLEASSGEVLRYGPDVFVSRFGSRGRIEATGPLVVIAGSEDPAAALEGVDLSGAHVAVVPAAGVMGLRDEAVLNLVRSGVLGGAHSLLLADDSPDDAWAERSRESRARTGSALGEVPEGGTAFLQIRDRALDELLASLGLAVADLRSEAGGPVTVREVPDMELTLHQEVRVESEQTAPNVVAVLEGSDPDLRDEYVVFSAHMDHVGVRSVGEGGDSIWNGADDNASGTALVVEVAEAMAALSTAPRRSMIFLTVSGEEKGLWGSRYYADHPTVPVDHLVANINSDMVGRNWPDTIVAIGKEHSDLGETLERVNRAHPELNMNAIDDRWPEENFYRRSDHFNFARKGVPVLFFFNGTHEDYHQPSDEAHEIREDKASRISQLVFWLGLEIANADERPQWNPESYREIVEGGR